MNFSSNSKSDCIALVEAFKVSFPGMETVALGTQYRCPATSSGMATPPSVESVTRPLMFSSNSELCWEQ